MYDIVKSELFWLLIAADFVIRQYERATTPKVVFFYAKDGWESN